METILTVQATVKKAKHPSPRILCPVIKKTKIAVATVVVIATKKIDVKRR